jgi:hypothetical protein
MTNEELLEELYYEVHNKGLIDQFRQEIDSLKVVRQNLTHLELAEVAYEKIVKSDFGKQS